MSLVSVGSFTKIKKNCIYVQIHCVACDEASKHIEMTKGSLPRDN